MVVGVFVLVLVLLLLFGVVVVDVISVVVVGVARTWGNIMAIYWQERGKIIMAISA
jgi:hypothetical protein